MIKLFLGLIYNILKSISKKITTYKKLSISLKHIIKILLYYLLRLN